MFIGSKICDTRLAKKGDALKSIEAFLRRSKIGFCTCTRESSTRDGKGKSVKEIEEKGV